MFEEIQVIGTYYKTDKPRPIFCTAILAAFFLPNPFDQVSEAVAGAVQYYTDHIPANVLRWESIGANKGQWDPSSEKTIQRCLAHLRPKMVAKRTMTALEVRDGEVAHDPARYSFLAMGDAKDPKEFEGKLALFECRWPLSSLKRVDELLEHIKALAELLPYESVYVSPEWSLEYWADAPRMVKPYAERYPGYDLQRNYATRLELSGSVRGARWISLLGPDLIKKLGGAKKIAGAFSEKITVENLGQGLMIQAGSLPEIGDAQKGIGTPLLSEVAHFLKPITRFEETELLGLGLCEDRGEGDAFLEKWTRRFLSRDAQDHKSQPDQ